MNLEFYNCPQPEGFDAKYLPKEIPEFVNYKPDFELLKKLAEEFKSYENILVVAHGGSINSLYGFYFALKYQTKKNIHFLSTLDPDYIFELKQKLSPSNTLVLSISKSGENISQLEETMPFVDYPIIIVTAKSSPLRAIGEKLGLREFQISNFKFQKKGCIITHPNIGGRFTGLTEVNLLGAAIAGIDTKALWEGGQEFYQVYQKDNLAWKTASIFYQLEKKGYTDVLMFFYSHYLFPLSFGIVQLCHESFGKAGKGQTYFAHEGPEVQHHTTQRFYGGPKDIAGIFITAENFLHPTVNNFPPAVHSVQLKGRHIFDIDKIPLGSALQAEWQGNIEDARIQGIPIAHISLRDFSSKEIGAFTAFWQLYAVYASLLRQVNPFDQPQVENSKNISFSKRLHYKGLL